MACQGKQDRRQQDRRQNESAIRDHAKLASC
jgi:hypothetical protein